MVIISNSLTVLVWLSQSSFSDIRLSHFKLYAEMGDSAVYSDTLHVQAQYRHSYDDNG